MKDFLFSGLSFHGDLLKFFLNHGDPNEDDEDTPETVPCNNNTRFDDEGADE